MLSKGRHFGGSKRRGYRNSIDWELSVPLREGPWRSCCILWSLQGAARYNSGKYNIYSRSLLSNLPLVSNSILYFFYRKQQRTNFYQTMVALEDVETQKRGIVLVLFSHYYEGHHTIGMERLRRSQNFLRGLPFKFMGVHNCCSQESMPFFLPFQNVIQYLIGSDGRRHFRTQCGKNIEYALQSRVANNLERFDNI
jgi:hypothetical protein